MTSWQRRMAAVDRRYSFQAMVDEPTAGTDPSPAPGDDRPAVGTAGPVEMSTATLTTSPSTAERLAALLREERPGGHDRRVALVGTA